jgi:hippurate hydrolase
MLVRSIRALSLVTVCLLPSARAETPAEWATSNMNELVEIYREFHRHPELSLQEEQTAARMAALLKDAGVEVHTGVGGHGVVGLLKNGPGPTLMLRTDLDALPVEENTNLAYASQVKVKNTDGTTTGVMHACGHDIHMTNLVAVARYELRFEFGHRLHAGANEDIEDILHVAEIFLDGFRDGSH